ncbi:hypothetical protein AMS68_008016 [Peltaster fructicola]|uniref:ABC transporter domain-containing protein n=1 Tax=Peltaster fructicola TaxID=286661 RepID=A0A6H0Y6Q0_9PEZI|nr:hypothetical protein AMS68_008016 [Peltaster fructicola]
MVFLRQTRTLIEKTLLIVLVRSWLGTLVRCLIAPVVFLFFISYAKNFFVPPSDFGIGSPHSLITFEQALGQSAGGRNTVAFVNGGHTGGNIERVINSLASTVTANGKNATILRSETELLYTCKSSIRGVTPCFAAISFVSSPNEGSSGKWNYTIFSDGALGTKIYVGAQNNDAEIYALPLQHAIDNAIASINGTSLPSNVQHYPYTSQTPAQRNRQITRLYMGTLITILAVAYFVGIVGICYELTGFMARERELGMSQLIEAMMPNRRRWEPQVARLLAVHITYDMLYLPSWIIGGVIISRLNYPTSSVGIVVGFFILSGLALSSWSLAFATLFKKAQLSGITVVIVSIVLAIIIQVVPPTSSAAAGVLALIFPPMNYTLFIIYMAYWEQQTLPAQLGQGPPTAPWHVSGYAFYIFCVVQIIVYPIIGALIERTLYGTGTKTRELRYDERASEQAVKVTGLAKYYSPSFFSRFGKNGKQVVRAVDNIDFSVLRGQIMVLLGANGSGKSTTLDMLAGLQKPTTGQIEMDASGGIGLCPQRNVLWDELTVYEHVKIFNRLKADKVDNKAALQALVNACDLEIKLKAKTGTLSGGQKRKCQLAMMLTGGSSICMLDEVSSGLDPLSRRKIWDILLAERGKRSMLLTTHFLDEADLLSDDITILSKGKLVASGSAVTLKHKLGGGYRVRIYHENKRELPAELENTPKHVYHDQTVYSMASSAAAARFVAGLEQAGVTDYQVNGPTIEDVFLNLAEEVKEELDKDKMPESPDSASDDGTPRKTIAAESDLQLAKGNQLSFWGQTLVLFRKRLVIVRHNPFPYLAAFLIPIIAAGLVSLFLKGLTALSCHPEDNLTPSIVTSLATYLGFNATIPVGPADRVSIPYFYSIYPLLNPPPFKNVSSLQAMQDYVSNNFNTTRPGAIFVGDTPTFAWRGNYGMYYAIAIQNLLDNALLTNIPIIANYNTFAIPWGADMGNTLQFTLYFGLAMSAVPGFFSLYPNAERLRNVRALHYSNGVRAGPLWLAYTLFDFIILIVASAIVVIIFNATFGAWYGIGYLFLVFVLFGLSAILMSYVVSLFTTSQLASFAFAAGGQCVFFLLYFISLLCILTYAPAADVDRDVLIANYTIALFFPAGNLLRAILVAFNDFSLTCRGTDLAPYPGAFDVYGSCILYLILQSIVFLVILIWYDSGYKPGFLGKTKQKAVDDEQKEDVDTEVWEEASRVDTSSDALRVKHATKVFGTNVAVDDVSFGVPIGQTFALLGPNGAGKSTTIGLIRGDTRPTGRYSEILVEDRSIIASRAAARAYLGVCPQFDAMDQMTAVEHLRFYARARGVKDVEHNVERVIHAVGLAPFKTRMASKLSGGNKRKLSLGVALIGNPSVLLLDEPSSGMDAASKRVMWRTLRAVASGRSLVLTTHSMEEADALADRAGIMARRMLALGTSDQLRKKHGDAYHVHLVHKDAPYTSEADMDDIKAFIRRTFSGAEVEDRTFHGQLRFSVPNDRTQARNEPDVQDTDAIQSKKGAIATVVSSSGVSRSGIAALFAELEANKEKLGFEYYSVSQATLDQVFLSIVSKHNVEEENYARAHPKKNRRLASLPRALLCGF